MSAIDGRSMRIWQQKEPLNKSSAAGKGTFFIRTLVSQAEVDAPDPDLCGRRGGAAPGDPPAGIQEEKEKSGGKMKKNGSSRAGLPFWRLSEI